MKTLLLMKEHLINLETPLVYSPPADLKIGFIQIHVFLNSKQLHNKLLGHGIARERKQVSRWDRCQCDRNSHCTPGQKQKSSGKVYSFIFWKLPVVGSGTVRAIQTLISLLAISTLVRWIQVKRRVRQGCCGGDWHEIRVAVVSVVVHVCGLSGSDSIIKLITIIRSSSLNTRGLGLCPFTTVIWSVICFPGQDGVSWSAKGALPKSISVTIFTSTAWRTLGLLGAFPAPVGGHHFLGAMFLGS